MQCQFFTMCFKERAAGLGINQKAKNEERWERELINFCSCSDDRNADEWFHALEKRAFLHKKAAAEATAYVYRKYALFLSQLQHTASKAWFEPDLITMI